MYSVLYMYEINYYICTACCICMKSIIIYVQRVVYVCIYMYSVLYMYEINYYICTACCICMKSIIIYVQRVVYV